MNTYELKIERRKDGLSLPVFVASHFMVAILLIIGATSPSDAHAATGNLAVFDDADLNGFNHAAAACGSSAGTYYNSTVFVHSGTAAVGVTRLDNVGVGWVAPAIYSTASDYDGVSFWFNAGNYPTQMTSLVVVDAANQQHFVHLEDVYGGPLPIHLWLNFQVSFSSPLFAVNSSYPSTLKTLCFINHSSGAQGPNYFISFDDVSLVGATIFKSGFE